MVHGPTLRDAMVRHINRHQQALPVTIWKIPDTDKWRPNEHMWDPRRQKYFGGGDARVAEVRGLQRYVTPVDGVAKVVCPCGHVVGNAGQNNGLRAMAKLAAQFIRHAKSCSAFGNFV